MRPSLYEDIKISLTQHTIKATLSGIAKIAAALNVSVNFSMEFFVYLCSVVAFELRNFAQRLCASSKNAMELSLCLLNKDLNKHLIC